MKQRLTPDEVRALFEQKRWRQEYLPLTRVVTVEHSRSCICIPDRDSAECERTRLQREHGERLLKVTIIKDRPGKHAGDQPRTYPVNYTYTETQTENLF
jgi:hypothetical protein